MAQSSDKCICLFDMDGTLTQPRKSIDRKMITALRELSKMSVTIGIVSGSPWEYIHQQMSRAWKADEVGLYPDLVKIMPCNGTQLLEWSSSTGKYETVYKVDFKKHVNELAGKNVYNEFVRHILELQMEFIEEYNFENLTGNFVSYRTSMINWSPVGRDAKDKDREAFMKLDDEKDVRNKLRESLRVRLDDSGLHETDLNLGGFTSIDIHPTGWDKTHALRHCGNAKVWFVGDKCMVGGNDHTLYKHLTPHSRSFSTTGPEETEEIIRDHIMPHIERKES